MNKRDIIPNDVPKLCVYFNRTAFHRFSKISLLGVTRCGRRSREKYEISKDLEISVKACGAIRLGVLSKFKFDRRIRIQPPAADR